MLNQLTGSRQVDQQLRRNDCGISTVKTICNLLDVNIARSYIEKEISISERGSSLDSLKQFFDDHPPFEAHFHLLDLNDAAEVERRMAHRTPCIVAVEKGNALHYVVIESVKKGAFRILDPSGGRRERWTLAELRRRAYTTDAALDMVEMREKVDYLVRQELQNAGIEPADTYSDGELTDLYNKLSYFTYVDEEFGFRDDAAARSFLEDLVENQDLSAVPKHFRSLKARNDQVKIRAPVILTVHSTDEEDLPAAFSSEEENVYVTLFKTVGATRRLWYVFLGASLVAALLTQLAVFINQLLIDEVLPAHDLHVLTLFAVGVAVFRLFQLALGLFVQYVSIHLGNELDLLFLAQFDAKLSGQPMAYLSGFRKGDLIERLSDSLKVKKFFIRFFSKIFIRAVVSVVSVAILLTISWKVTLLIIAALGGLGVIFLGLAPRFRQVERERFRQKADLFSRFVQKIEGLASIRSFGLQEWTSRDLEASSVDYIKVQTRGGYWNLLNRGLAKIVTTGVRLAVLVFCAQQLITVSALTLGQLVAFVALSSKVLKSFRRLMQENLRLQKYHVILNRFFNFGQASAAKMAGQGISDFEIKTLAAEHVAFSYEEEGEPLLRDANFEVQRGENVCITGPNGSGKSTLGRIVGLLYPPGEGRLKINGIDRALYDEAALQRKMLFVSGDDTLFNEPLRFNLTLGRPVKTKKIVRYARQVGLYDYVIELPDRLDRMIDEDGSNLSQGQKHKVILLRALLSEADVIVFDELLRSIDAASGLQIERLLNEMVHRTFIFITHGTLEGVDIDRYFTLQEGQLTEGGAQ